MQPVHINLLFAAHALLLVCSARSIAAGCFDQPSLRLLASVVLIWLNLIHSAQLASLGGKLGSPLWYLLCSAIVALIHYAVLRFPLDPNPRKPAPGWRATFHGLRGWRWLPVLATRSCCSPALSSSPSPSTPTIGTLWPTASPGSLLPHHRRPAPPGGDSTPASSTTSYNGSLLYLFWLSIR